MKPLEMNSLMWRQDSEWARRGQLMQNKAAGDSVALQRVQLVRQFLGGPWSKVFTKWVDAYPRIMADPDHIAAASGGTVAWPTLENELLYYINRILYPKARAVGFSDASFLLPDICIDATTVGAPLPIISQSIPQSPGAAMPKRPEHHWYEDGDVWAAALGTAALASSGIGIGLALASKANNVVAAAKAGSGTATKKVAAVKALADSGDPVAQETVKTMKVMSAMQDQKSAEAQSTGFYDQGLNRVRRGRRPFAIITIGHDPYTWVGGPPPLGGGSSRGPAGGVTVTNTAPGGGRVFTPQQNTDRMRQSVAYGGKDNSVALRFHGGQIPTGDPSRFLATAKSMQESITKQLQDRGGYMPSVVNQPGHRPGTFDASGPQGPIDPGSGYPTDGNGNPYDPATGQPIDPTTGLPYPPFDPSQYGYPPDYSYGGGGGGGYGGGPDPFGGGYDGGGINPYCQYGADPYSQYPYDPYGQAGLPYDPYGQPYDPNMPYCTQKQTYDPATDSFYSNQVNQVYDPDTNSFSPSANYNPYNPYMTGQGYDEGGGYPFDPRVAGWAFNHPYRTTAQHLASIDKSPGVALSARELYNQGLGRGKTTKGDIASEALRGHPQVAKLYNAARRYF